MKKFNKHNGSQYHNDSIVARAAVCFMNDFSQAPSVPSIDRNTEWTYVSASCVEDDYEGF